MGLYSNFPYTNFHEMNLDWILQELKNLVDAWDSYGTSVSATAHAASDPEVTVTGDLKNGLAFDFGLVEGPRGQTGAQGPQGPEGPAGTGLEILDVYPTLAALQADHPTGTAGDMYLVGTGGSYTLYVWSDSQNDWENGGSLSAPSPSNTSPAMDGTAAAGSSLLYARGDHVHPSDTNKLDASATDGIYGVDSGSQVMFNFSDNALADALVMYDSVGDINTANLNASGDVSGVNMSASGDISVSGDITIAGDINSSDPILTSDMLAAEVAGLNAYRPLCRINNIDPISLDYDIATLVPNIKTNVVDYNDEGTMATVTSRVYFTDNFTVDTVNYGETRIDLKPASASQLGSVKIGTGVSVAADGTISVSPSSETPFATSGSVSITSSTSTGTAPTTSGVDLHYKMTGDAREFMLYGSMLAKGSTVNTMCDITTSLQVDPPASTITIPGLPILSQSSSPTAGNYLSIDTSGYVHIHIYAVVNNNLLTFPPVRIKLDEWA